MPILTNTFIILPQNNFRLILIMISSIHFSNSLFFTIRTNPNFFNLNTLFILSIPNHLHICLINNFSISSSIWIRNRHWNLSSNRQFINRRSWHRNSSRHRHSFEFRILYMINIILLIIFLNNWLNIDLSSWNWNRFNSSNILSLNRLNNWLQYDFLIISSIHLNIYSFSLNYWLVKSLLVNLCTWFDNYFFSVIFSYKRFFCQWS